MKEKLVELLKDYTAENLNQIYPLSNEEVKAIIVLKRKDLFTSWLEFNNLTENEQLFLIEPENNDMLTLYPDKLSKEVEIALMKHNHPAALAYILKNGVSTEALDALVCGDNFDLFLFMVQEYPDYEAVHAAIQRHPEHKMYKRIKTRSANFKSHERELIDGNDLEAFEAQCQYLGLSNTNQKHLVDTGYIKKFQIFIKYNRLTNHEAQIALVEAKDKRLALYLEKYGSESLCEFAQILLP